MPVAIPQIFIPITELIIPIEIPSKNGKAEIQRYPVTTEAKISECSI